MLIKGGVEGVEVLFVQLILGNAQAFAETLVVDDLTLTQELDGFADIGIIDQPQDVVVSSARLLFCCTLVCANFSSVWGGNCSNRVAMSNGMVYCRRYS